MTAYVGVDLHRRRSLAVCLDDTGERLWWKRFDNSLQTLVARVPDLVIWSTHESLRCCRLAAAPRDRDQRKEGTPMDKSTQLAIALAVAAVVAVVASVAWAVWLS